jgi:glycosyltransferase involved in cell wall biosynthesis
MEGYFRQRLDVLKLTMASLVAHTSSPHDLMVMDNGSCSDVVAYLTGLHQEGMIDYLLLSQRNLGKIGAFKVLFNAAPGEVVAYSDDDILYYPGWLEAHLRILDSYPRVGMVSGMPVRNASDRARQSLMMLVKDPPEGLTVTHEHHFPDAWEVDWAISTGRDPEEHLARIRNQKEWVLRYRGVEAYGSASHFQFVAPRVILHKALPDRWSGKLMGEMVELDEAVDALGYLRLSTVDRYARHIGNTISLDVQEEIRRLNLPLDMQVSRVEHYRHWLLRIPGSGRILRYFYNRLFEILHQVR